MRPVLQTTPPDRRVDLRHPQSSARPRTPRRSRPNRGAGQSPATHARPDRRDLAQRLHRPNRQTLPTRLRQLTPLGITLGTATWMVPLTGLLAAGLHVNTSDHGQPSSMDDQVDDHGRASEHPSRARLTELEQQVAVLRAELSGARAVAEERAKRAETAERALLMLEAHNPRPDSFANVSPRPMSPPPLPVAAPPTPTPSAEPRPRWWRRRTQ